MPTIWGQVESVVNHPQSTPNLVLITRTPVGTRRTQCLIEAETVIEKGFQRLAPSELHGGEFVVVALGEHSGRLQTERIDVIVFADRAGEDEA